MRIDLCLERIESCLLLHHRFLSHILHQLCDSVLCADHPVLKSLRLKETIFLECQLLRIVLLNPVNLSRKEENRVCDVPADHQHDCDNGNACTCHKQNHDQLNLLTLCKNFMIISDVNNLIVARSQI